MEQLSLFPKPKLTYRDLAGIVRRMPPDYIRQVCQTALEVALANEDFSAEDVRIYCEPPKGCENAFSSAMLEARRLGIFEVTGYRKAARAQAKSRIIPVYRRNF